MIEKASHLEGFLVGIGVEHIDGTMDFKWLDEPVHNTIVKSGINHMLRYGGDNNKLCGLNTGSSVAAPFFNRGCSPDYKYISDIHRGIFTYMAIGTGTGNTSEDMTSLEHAVANSDGNIYESTVLAGSPYCGTGATDFGAYRFRTTHKSVVVTGTTVVSEFGLFGWTKNGTVENYPMFCRITIPSALRVTLQAGERAIFTYQLNCNQTVVGAAQDGFALNLKDEDGNDLGYFAEMKSLTTSKNSSILTGLIPFNDSQTTQFSGKNYSKDGEDFNYSHVHRPRGQTDLPVWTVLNSNINGYAKPITYVTNTWYNCQEMGWGNSTADYFSKNYYELYSTFNNSTSPVNQLSDDASEMWMLGQIMVDPYIEGSGERTYHLRMINNGTWNPWNLRLIVTRGMILRFYKIVDGEKVYTPISIYPGNILQFNFKMSYVADNTPA